ncbi:MAG: hypothetical protein AB8C95_11005 [Phycisphaeraceae bacterium]
MNHARPIPLMLTGLCWAMSMLVLGLTSLMIGPTPDPTRLAMGLALIGASLFLMMWLVIDPLVPDAGRIFTGTLKLATLVVFYVYAALMLVSGWPIVSG